MNRKLKNILISELAWTATKQGAFQRARIYSSNLEVSAKQKNKLRSYLKMFCYEHLFCRSLNNTIDEESLIKIIDKLCNETEGQFKDILKDGKFQFGNAQKFVNLYLKLLWVLGKSKEPPHFPVDRIIQHGFRNILPWTDMNKSDYLMVIEEAKKKARIKKLSLANWEADLYYKLNSQILFKVIDRNDHI